MGGTYMPVNGSYRTLTQCSSNVPIGWDWDGIYYEYWYWIFLFKWTFDYLEEGTRLQ